MPEPLRLYLDQMFRLDVAQALLGEGHDVMRAVECEAYSSGVGHISLGSFHLLCFELYASDMYDYFSVILENSMRNKYSSIFNSQYSILIT